MTRESINKTRTPVIFVIDCLFTFVSCYMGEVYLT